MGFAAFYVLRAWRQAQADGEATQRAPEGTACRPAKSFGTSTRGNPTTDMMTQEAPF